MTPTTLFCETIGTDRNASNKSCGNSLKDLNRGSLYASREIVGSELFKAAMIIEDIVTIYMSKAEVARDLHAVLSKAQQDVAALIEQNHVPIAVPKTPFISSRH